MSNPFPVEGIDISEQSRTPDGRVLTLDRRLFMQFLAFGASDDHSVLIARAGCVRVCLASSMLTSTIPSGWLC